MKPTFPQWLVALVALLGLNAANPQSAFGQDFFQTIQTWVSEQQTMPQSAQAVSETRYKTVYYTVCQPVQENCWKEVSTTQYKSVTETCYKTVGQTQVPYTVTKTVPYTVVSKQHYTVCSMVKVTKCMQVPYTVTRVRNECQIPRIPDTVTSDEALEHPGLPYASVWDWVNQMVTLEQALKQLQLQPRDPYLQYVVLQMARRLDRLGEVGGQVESIVFDQGAKGQEQRMPVGLFGLFVAGKEPLERLQFAAMVEGVAPQTAGDTDPLSTFWKRITQIGNIMPNPKTEPVREDAQAEAGVIACPPYLLEQPTLQEDTVLRAPSSSGSNCQIEMVHTPVARNTNTDPPSGTMPSIPTAKDTLDKVGDQVPAMPPVMEDEEQGPKLSLPVPAPPPSVELSQPNEPVPEASKYKEIVNLSELKTPEFKGQPCAELLGDKKTEVSILSRCVPADFFFAEFRSVAKLLEALNKSDQWGQYLALQTTQTAATKDAKNRIMRQLGLSLPMLELVKKCGGQVAITGSESLFGDAGDVTVLFLAPKTFPLPVSPKCTHLTNTDGSMSYYAAAPRAGLQIRSTSKVALQRVLDAIAGKDEAGNPVACLGDTKEFQYLRTLLKNDDTEDGFLYFPEAFQKRVASPAFQIAQHRRQLAHAHLRMIGHAALMYRSEHGRLAESLGTLAFAGCLPGAFNEGKLCSPGGGQYSLASDGLHGISDVYGRADALNPCIELPPIKQVTAAEAEWYDTFVANFEKSGRAGANPIALQLKLTDKCIEVEAFTPPPTGDPLFEELSKVLGGEPEYLDTLPVPTRNLLSVNVRFNKRKLLRQFMDGFNTKQAENLATLQDQAALLSIASRTVPLASSVAWVLARAYDHYLDNACSETMSGQPGGEALLAMTEGMDKEQKELVVSLEAFLKKGIGNQIGLHLYDAAVPIDVNLPAGLTQLFTPDEQSKSMLILAPLVGAAGAALTSPTYLSIPVQDAAIVDAFLDKLDKVGQPLVAKAKSATFWGFEVDLYQCLMANETRIHTCSLRYGPVRYRVYWGRIGKGLYIANSPVVFQDLQVAQDLQEEARILCPKIARPFFPFNRGPKAHAMLRLRPQHWDLALPGFRMAWAENNRIACIHNLGPLSSAARTLCGTNDNLSWDDRQLQVHACADQLYGKKFCCPEGGRYELTKDGKAMTCSIHGSGPNPRQPLEPAANSTVGRLMGDLTDVTAALTFAPEGLRMRLTIARK